MKNFFSDKQLIMKLDASKGGYFYMKIPKEAVEVLPNGKSTRIICSFNDGMEIRCGLNHYGDGNFFIILSTKNVRLLGKEPNDEVQFSLRIDPDPLGVDIPEVIEVLIAQDDEIAHRWRSLTDGKKRSIIHSVDRIKNIDLKVRRAVTLIEEVSSRSR